MSLVCMNKNLRGKNNFIWMVLQEDLFATRRRITNYSWNPSIRARVYQISLHGLPVYLIHSTLPSRSIFPQPRSLLFVASFVPFPNILLFNFCSRLHLLDRTVTAAIKQTYKCVISSHISSRLSRYHIFSITFLKQHVNFGIHALTCNRR